MAGQTQEVRTALLLSARAQLNELIAVNARLDSIDDGIGAAADAETAINNILSGLGPLVCVGAGSYTVGGALPLVDSNTLAGSICATLQAITYEHTSKWTP